MSVIDEFLRADERYASNFDKGDLAMPPGRHVAVVACMDARLNPYGILGLQEGEAHIIRNAGGAVTDDAIRSLAISQRLLGTRLRVRDSPPISCAVLPAQQRADVTIVLPDPGAPDPIFERPADRSRLERTAGALRARGFAVEMADSASHARSLVLAAIPEGAEVHSGLSETMRELGIAQEIDESGRYDSVRVRLAAMDRETQGREMRKLGAAPDYIVSSAHAITDDRSGV